jgi:Transposase, Mutator family
MPVPKKHTTSTSEAATVESSDHTMPDAQEFRQHLRNLAVSAMRSVIEEVMREELEQCLGAAWGECTAERKGYRNGTYTRDASNVVRSDQRSRSPQRSRGELPYPGRGTATTATKPR